MGVSVRHVRRRRDPQRRDQLRVGPHWAARTRRPGDVPDFQDALNDLSLPDLSGRAPPTWVHAGWSCGPTTATSPGVVVDDFDCRSVRLTDNPHTTPPGADDQDGTVAGVLGGGTAILDPLGVGRTS